MKKILFPLLFLLAITFQSCSVNTTAVYHKDAAQSIQMDIDMKEFIQFTSSLDENKNGTPKKSKTPESFEKAPKEWTSLYEIQKAEGKPEPKDQDSIKLLKRIFMKGMFNTKNEFQGISMKVDKVTRDEVEKYSKKFSEKKAPMLDNGFNNWDGKRLIINTEEMSMEKAFAEMAKGMNTKKEKAEPKNDTEKKIAEASDKIKDLFKMLDLKVTTNLRFESKIKTITGKHDFIKQIDDHTMQITFNTKDIDEKMKELKNKDKIIVIETE